MGRYMPEKNHRNLIRAVKKIKDAGYNVVCYIIGDGKLRDEYQSLIKKLGLSDVIILTGTLQNPLALMRRCNCFVFPSIYEAQGLAVLEARSVGLPIVVGNYETVSSVLLDDKQYVLKGSDVDSIYEGLLAAIKNEIPSDYKFDFVEYNKNSLKEFYDLMES